MVNVILNKSNKCIAKDMIRTINKGPVDEICNANSFIMFTIVNKNENIKIPLCEKHYEELKKDLLQAFEKIDEYIKFNEEQAIENRKKLHNLGLDSIEL